MLSDGYSKGLLLNILRIFGTIVNTHQTSLLPGHLSIKGKLAPWRY